MTGVEHILEFLAERAPLAVVNADSFPSGSVSIEVRLQDEVLVVEYQHRQGYGVSRLAGGAADEFTGHDRVFATEEAVVRYLATVLGL